MINPKSAFETDDRGVSPVIGVILMVAITVILAAVIGTFVLNLGGDLQETPQAQISIENTDTTGEVQISHNGGDTVQFSNLDITIDPNTAGNSFPTSSEFSVGGSETVDTGESDGTEVTVTVVHTPSESILVENTVTV